MLQPKQSGADGKAGYLTGNTESIPGGPYDRGDASRRDMQTKSDCDRKHNIEVVQAGSTLDVPAEEHSKLATKVIRRMLVLILIKLGVFVHYIYPVTQGSPTSLPQPNGPWPIHNWAV